ncbi:cysteine desulfurase [Candidatus Parcubacteria bacterium]|nr:cysteine desulfurase [Candidatus Parcubacteria bacterium]
MQKIYFDHSATTPVDKKVLNDMLPYFTEKFGNASSIHSFGNEAMAGVDKARKQIADSLNCNSSELIFTSGATESNNIAIKGLIQAFRKKNPNKKIHIITSVIEHDAVLEPFLEMEQKGVELTFLPVESNGLVNIEKVKNAIQDNTILVSIMFVNSEIGTILPIREIGKTIKKVNGKRLNNWKKCKTTSRGDKPQRIYFHTDVTQAVNFIDCNVQWNYIDLLSLSAHKIYGPKGVGALYKKEGILLEALQCGGHHENNIRSGTLNVPGIVGLGSAIAQIDSKTRDKNNIKITELRDRLVSGIIKNIPDVKLNTDRKVSTPSHAHFTFFGVEGESVLISLDLEGIAVSTGSACASGNLKASHVLIAIGIRKEIAHSSIRFTLGKYNTKKEVDKLIQVLPKIIKKIRNINPLYELTE